MLPKCGILKRKQVMPIAHLPEPATCCHFIDLKGQQKHVSIARGPQRRGTAGSLCPQLSKSKVALC